VRIGMRCGFCAAVFDGEVGNAGARGEGPHVI
jgi:hypothetical protein